MIPSRQVLSHRPDIQILESQINQDIPDFLCAPQRILTADPANEFPLFDRDGFAAHFTPGFPSPKPPKRLLLPADYRSGLHRMTGALPSIPYPRKHDPKEPEGIGKPPHSLGLTSSQVHIQLAFQCNDPGGRPTLGQENRANENPGILSQSQKAAKHFHKKAKFPIHWRQDLPRNGRPTRIRKSLKIKLYRIFHQYRGHDEGSWQSQDSFPTF